MYLYSLMMAISYSRNMFHNTFLYREYIFVTDSPSLLNNISQQAVTHKEKR